MVSSTKFLKYQHLPVMTPNTVRVPGLREAETK